MLNGLDLFSGYGGVSLALKEWVRPVTYCEIDRYAQSILCSRIADSSLPYAPIWDDIRTLTSSTFKEAVPIDIIYGGFPCQDISVAGHGKGLAGERSGLFYEVCRLVKEINPRFVFLENVPAIRTKGLREVVREFTDLGYDCRWTCVSASEVGAKHLRKRWFLLAHSNSKGLEGFQETRNTSQIGEKQAQQPSRLLEGRVWFEEALSSFVREANGSPARMDRIKALGNGVVPHQVKKAFEKLLGV